MNQLVPKSGITRVSVSDPVDGRHRRRHAAGALVADAGSPRACHSRGFVIQPADPSRFIIGGLMEPITETRLRQLFTRAHIEAADVTAGIGQELRYRDNPRRVIVIHLAETDSLEYRIELVSRVLEMDEEWVLITRYGSIGDLGLLPGVDDAAGLSFEAVERQALATYLCSRSTHLAAISADLYVLGSSGNALVTWDHHSADEGITVDLQSVSDAGRLLVSLNELGAELELFYQSQ